MDNIAMQCCVCKRYKWGNNDYRKEPPFYVAEDNVSHGYCKPCAKAELEKMNKEEWVS